MKITYRSKNTPTGIAIQVDGKLNEDIKDLIPILINKGFKYEPSNIPPSFNHGNITHYFYRNGSDVFGLKTPDELQSFIEDSADVLISFDETFNPTVMYSYDND